MCIHIYNQALIQFPCTSPSPQGGNSHGEYPPGGICTPGIPRSRTLEGHFKRRRVAKLCACTLAQISRKSAKQLPPHGERFLQLY